MQIPRFLCQFYEQCRDIAAGIPRKAAETMIRKMMTFVPLWQRLCDESLLPLDLKQTLTELIRARCVRLT